MEAYIPLLCLVAVTALLWFTALRRRPGNRPVVWNWWTVGLVVIGAVGAAAVPLVIATVLNS